MHSRLSLGNFLLMLKDGLLRGKREDLWHKVLEFEGIDIEEVSHYVAVYNKETYNGYVRLTVIINGVDYSKASLFPNGKQWETIGILFIDILMQYTESVLNVLKIEKDVTIKKKIVKDETGETQIIVTLYCNNKQCELRFSLLIIQDFPHVFQNEIDHVLKDMRKM